MVLGMANRKSRFSRKKIKCIELDKGSSETRGEESTIRTGPLGMGPCHKTFAILI